MNLFENEERLLDAIAIPRKEAEARFEEAWSIYPRKQGKAAARRKFLRMADVDRGVLCVKLIPFAAEWAKAPKDKIKYCPHGSTWFNGKWEDDLQETLADIKRIIGRGSHERVSQEYDEPPSFGRSQEQRGAGEAGPNRRTQR